MQQEMTKDMVVAASVKIEPMNTIIDLNECTSMNI